MGKSYKRSFIIHVLFNNKNWLVVSTILKNMKVNGKDYPIYDMENNFFENTNQN